MATKKKETGRKDRHKLLVFVRLSLYSDAVGCKASTLVVTQPEICPFCIF